MFKNTIKPIFVIWERETLRFIRNRMRIVAEMVRTFLWLVMFGTGISGALRFNGGGPFANFNYVQFLFPGVIGMTLLFTSLFSAITTVRDREFGFLKAVLVAPVSRVGIALGKILGAATIACIQGFLIIIILPLVGIPLKLSLILLVPIIFLCALMLSSLGLFISAQIRNVEGFQTIMQFITMPMFMFSGALFPLKNIPLWMKIVSRINPATYAVDLLRQITFRLLGIPELVRSYFYLTIFGRQVTPLMDALVVVFFSIIFILTATKLFAQQER